METWATRLEAVNRLLGRTVAWAAVLMALIQFVSVVLRYAFGTSYIFVQESLLYLNALLFMVGSGYTLLVDGHVRVDIFYGEASPRRKALVDLLGVLFLLYPGCLALLWFTWSSVVHSWSILEGAISVGGLPASYLLKSLMPVFALLLILQGTALALRSLATLREPAR